MITCTFVLGDPPAPVVCIFEWRLMRMMLRRVLRVLEQRSRLLLTGDNWFWHGHSWYYISPFAVPVTSAGSVREIRVDNE